MAIRGNSGGIAWQSAVTPAVLLGTCMELAWNLHGTCSELARNSQLRFAWVLHGKPGEGCGNSVLLGLGSSEGQQRKELHNSDGVIAALTHVKRYLSGFFARLFKYLNLNRSSAAVCNSGQAAAASLGAPKARVSPGPSLSLPVPPCPSLSLPSPP